MKKYAEGNILSQRTTTKRKAHTKKKHIKKYAIIIIYNIKARFNNGECEITYYGAYGKERPKENARDFFRRFFVLCAEKGIPLIP